ncbi:MAG: hypothetical protein M3N51_09535 [Actinomycetota bacterium]|nr:hypothetical protein [Actinomycetota bacterium]
MDQATHQHSAAPLGSNGPTRQEMAASSPRGAIRPTTLALMFVSLIAATDVTLRNRDPVLALQGNVDAQILFEVLAWGLVGA